MTVTMEAVTKSVEASVRDVDTENPNGDFVLILSKDNLDRDDENLWAYEWMEPLPARLHIDTDHAFAKGMSVPLTAGSGVPEISEDGDLLVKGSYAGTPHGQLTRQLVKEGHIWQASVSYQLKELPDGRIVREVLNGTFTGVPCNPEAVVLSSKDTVTQSVIYRDDVDGKTNAPLTPGTHHADPGYLDGKGNPAKGGNGVPRYQLDDAAHVRNALARFSQNAAAAKYTPAQRSSVLGRIRSAARKFDIDVSDKGGEKALIVALCKAITVAKDFPQTTTMGDDLGARSVYDPSDDEDHAGDDEGDDDIDIAQAIHDTAIALGAKCKHADHEHATLSSLEASLKSIVQPVIRGYNITVAGPPGQEMFTVNKGDTVVGHGTLGELVEAEKAEDKSESKSVEDEAVADPAPIAQIGHVADNIPEDQKAKSPAEAAAAAGATSDEIHDAAEGEEHNKAVTVADPDTKEKEDEDEDADETSDEPVTVVATDDPETLPQSTDEKATAAADTKAAAAATSPADEAARVARAKARVRNFQFNNNTTLIENDTLETETE